MTCLDLETAAAYLAGDLDHAAAERWATHVPECAACRELIREASALIDEVRNDLRVLDGALEDTAPAPVDRIFEHGSQSAAVHLTSAFPGAAADPLESSDPSESRRHRWFRSRRSVIAIAATTILVAWLTGGSASAAAVRVRNALVRVASYITLVVRPSAPAPRSATASRASAADIALPREAPPAPSPATVAPLIAVTKPVPEPLTTTVALERDELNAWHQLHVMGLQLGREATARQSGHSVVVSIAIGGEARRAAAEAALKRWTGAPQTVVRMSTPPVERTVPGVATTSPLFDALRQHFATTPQPVVVAEEYSRSIQTTGERLRERTASLKQFIEAFPASRLRGLDFDAAAQWRRVVRDHVLEIGATAATLREHLSMLAGPPADAREPDIEALSAVEPAVIAFLRLSTDASESLDRATSAGQTGATLAPLVDALQRLARDSERFSGPWDLSR